METRYIYLTLNEVPESWRQLKGARLSLSQINSIIQDAYDTRFKEDLPDYGGAKARFEEKHQIVNGLWKTK